MFVREEKGKKEKEKGKEKGTGKKKEERKRDILLYGENHDVPLSVFPLIQPDALFLEEVFQVGHLGVEDFVVVVLFELLDVFQEFFFFRDGFA